MKYFLLAALGLLGAVGGSWYWQQRQETRLLTELFQLTQTLYAVNARAYHTAAEALHFMRETIAKNRDQPRDMAVLATATHLQAQATQLLDTLRGQRAALRRATAHLASAGPLYYLDERRNAGLTSAPQRLQHQAHAYTATLQQLPAPDSLGLSVLRFGHLPLAAVLADLSHLENQILTSEIRAIRQLHRTVGALKIAYRLVPVATAEAAIVAPGDTYRAHLFLLKILLPHSLHMYCNNQPITVGADGTGYVRFRAPRQPGPASWVGKIRINQNGRDTTFTVRVPYRVARR